MLANLLALICAIKGAIEIETAVIGIGRRFLTVSKGGKKRTPSPFSAG